MIEAFKLVSYIFCFTIFAIKVGLFKNPTRSSMRKKNLFSLRKVWTLIAIKIRLYVNYEKNYHLRKCSTIC